MGSRSYIGDQSSDIYHQKYQMPPSDFATADIDKVVDELTTDEATLLTAGVGFWNTYSVDRLGIPTIKVCPFHDVPCLDLSRS